MVAIVVPVVLLSVLVVAIVVCVVVICVFKVSNNYNPSKLKLINLSFQNLRKKFNNYCASLLHGYNASHGYVDKPVGGEVSNGNDPSHCACTH